MSSANEWPHAEANGLPERVRSLYYAALNASYNSDCWPQTVAKDDAAMKAWEKYEEARRKWREEVAA